MTLEATEEDPSTAMGALNPARDRLLQEVLLIANEDRKQLLAFCHSWIPEDMDYVDWVIYALALWHAKRVDIYEQYSGHESFGSCLDKGKTWNYNVDDHGRIKFVSLWTAWDKPFDLPKTIALLEKLEKIDVSNCRSLPTELSRLPNLKSLILVSCPAECFTVENFPDRMELSHLTHIEFFMIPSALSPLSLLTWVANHLPALEMLEFENFRARKKFTQILKLLGTLDFRCRETLKHIRANGCQMEDSDFSRLLLDVLPRFRNVHTLDVKRNNIESIVPTADRLLSDKRHDCVSKSLRRLYFYSNPIVNELLEEAASETKALLRILERLKTIGDIGITAHLICFANLYNRDIQYALRINNAGRCLVEVDPDATSFPLSVWPLVLERAFRKSNFVRGDKQNATGLHYMIRAKFAEIIPHSLSHVE